MIKKIAIIGAGPAGLSAAYILLKENSKKQNQQENEILYEVEIFEQSNAIGGISQTIDFNGNRMDIGGHRFFSKNDSVMDFWQNILPIQNENLHPENVDKILLIRKRLSRIYFLKQLFDYPLTLSWNFIQKLGFVRCFKIGVSYLKALIFPYQKVDNLEKFYINRFGSELYHLFFQDYTHKVWGKNLLNFHPIGGHNV